MDLDRRAGRLRRPGCMGWLNWNPPVVYRFIFFQPFWNVEMTFEPILDGLRLYKELIPKLK